MNSCWTDWHSVCCVYFLVCSCLLIHALAWRLLRWSQWNHMKIRISVIIGLSRFAHTCMAGRTLESFHNEVWFCVCVCLSLLCTKQAWKGQRWKKIWPFELLQLSATCYFTFHHWSASSEGPENMIEKNSVVLFICLWTSLEREKSLWLLHAFGGNRLM